MGCKTKQLPYLQSPFLSRSALLYLNIQFFLYNSYAERKQFQEGISKGTGGWSLEQLLL